MKGIPLNEKADFMRCGVRAADTGQKYSVSPVLRNAVTSHDIKRALQQLVNTSVITQLCPHWLKALLTRMMTDVILYTKLQIRHFICLFSWRRFNLFDLHPGSALSIL